MWLLNYVTKNSISKSNATCGTVTQSGNGKVEINQSQLHRELPVAAPYGIAYCIPVGEKSVVLPVEDGEVCVGVIAHDKKVQPGEIMLYSSAGSYIHLKNDGTVSINGQIFGGK